MHPQSKLVRYAIYTRQSVDKGGESSSCEVQFLTCQDFAKATGGRAPSALKGRGRGARVAEPQRKTSPNRQNAATIVRAGTRDGNILPRPCAHKCGGHKLRPSCIPSSCIALGSDAIAASGACLSPKAHLLDFREVLGHLLKEVWLER